MKKAKLLAACLFLVVCAHGQEDLGRKITKELCSEKYFGRGYIKQGDSLAAAYLARLFEAHGLEKMGDSYFQPFQFNVNTFPGEMKLVLNGKSLIPGEDFMVDPASGSSDLKWSYRYLPKEELFSEQVMADLLYQLRNKPTWNALVIDLRGITGDSLKQVKGFAQGIAQACHVMSVSDEKFTFSVAQEQLPYTYVHVHGESFEKGVEITSQVEAVFKENHRARNVIACLPATRKTKNTIVLTAHYDHLGGMGAATYFPGGNDNASGTSMLFALAEEFKQQKKRKSNYVFIAFAGEEAGLLGSKHFVDTPLVNLKRIRFLLNLDIMGSGEEGITVVNGSVYQKEFDRLSAINTEKAYVKQVKIRGKAANSDHYWFSENGVPAFFIYTMGPNKHYHDVFDTYEELSFSEYNDLLHLITEFIKGF